MRNRIRRVQSSARARGWCLRSSGAVILVTGVVMLQPHPVSAGDVRPVRVASPPRLEAVAPTGEAQLFALRQDAVDDVAQTLYAQSPDLVGLQVDPDSLRIDVYQPQVAVTEQVRARGGLLVLVVSHPSVHSKAEVESARAELLKVSDVFRVSAAIDGSFLNVGIVDAPELAEATPELREQARNTRINTLEQSIALPLKVTPSTTNPIVNFDATRWADEVPLSGGSAFKGSTTGGSCSTGFAVHKTDGTYSLPLILSADHCRPLVRKVFQSSGVVLGTTYEWDGDRDIMSVNTGYNRSRPQSVWNYIYDGGVAGYEGGGIGETIRPVRGSYTSSVGNSLCASGAFSGAVCLLKVVNTNVTIKTRNGPTYYNEIEVEQVNHAEGPGEGDSGGPVFSIRSDGWASARALVSAGDDNTEVPCFGVQGRVCSWRSYMSNLPMALTVMGLAVNTGVGSTGP